MFKGFVDLPNSGEACLLEKAHTLNSWGGSLLKLHSLEPAIDAFSAARSLYSSYPNNIVGLSETLTNLALAYTLAGRKTEASLAIQEAKQIACGNDQFHQINIAKVRLGLFSKELARELVLDAARAAEDAGLRWARMETSSVRDTVQSFFRSGPPQPGPSSTVGFNRPWSR